MHNITITNIRHVDVLDHGYVKLIDSWGSDEMIIEAARMSTDKGFLGWEDHRVCTAAPDIHGRTLNLSEGLCISCGSRLSEVIRGDKRLLKYLWVNKHMTPFEMAGMTIEVQAPIFVFREWHRHRTQGYNEMSARYVPLPHVDYMPDLDNMTTRAVAALESSNKQARGASNAKGDPVDQSTLSDWLHELEDLYRHAQIVYEHGLALGVPKELARLPVPVARYSRMRATANLRNWLAFLALRKPSNAQWEIRQYAGAVDVIAAQLFPRTLELVNTSDV